MGGRLDSILRVSVTQSCFFSLNAAAQLRVVSWGQAKPVILKPRWTEASRGKLIKDYPCQGPIQYHFSCSVVSDSLWPHGLQHTRLPCPSPTLGACSNSCPLSGWCHPNHLILCRLILFLPSIFPRVSLETNFIRISACQASGEWVFLKATPFLYRVIPVQGDKLYGLRDQLVFWIQIKSSSRQTFVAESSLFLRCIFLSQDKFSLTFLAYWVGKIIKGAL